VSESKAAGSHLDWLRARHDALKAERHYDMDVPAKLADLLGSETTTALGTLLWLFPSEIAVGIAAGQLSEWSTNADTELSESIAGE
jgi:hypothetical protein